jgi:hypothetical protein
VREATLPLLLLIVSREEGEWRERRGDNETEGGRGE